LCHDKSLLKISTAPDWIPRYS